MFCRPRLSPTPRWDAWSRRPALLVPEAVGQVLPWGAEAAEQPAEVVELLAAVALLLVVSPKTFLPQTEQFPMNVPDSHPLLEVVFCLQWRLDFVFEDLVDWSWPLMFWVEWKDQYPELHY